MQSGRIELLFICRQLCEENVIKLNRNWKKLHQEGGGLFYETVVSDGLHLSENIIMTLKLKSLCGIFTLSTMRKLRVAEEYTDPIEINCLSKEE